MALLNKTTTTQTKATETTATTNYELNIANGVQYATQEEAIEANAKAYAKKDFKVIKPALEEFGMSREDIIKIANQLLNKKRSIIVNFLAEKAEREIEELELPF